MKKKLEDVLKEFWGPERWDNLDNANKDQCQHTNKETSKDFLIEKYLTQFPDERSMETERKRL